MTGPQFFLRWPGAHLREIGAASALGVLLLIGNLFWQPSVQPFLPAELKAADPEPVVVSGMAEEESLDFIFRPLFLTARRPLERVIPEAVVVVESSQQDAPDTRLLDQYQLLGVFSSGDRGGVILLDKAKERVRLSTGDTIEGWILDRTDLRSAYFRGADGSVASLNLAVASTLPMPATAALPGVVEADASVNSAADAGDNKEAPPAYDGPVTFESIADRQRQETEAKVKARNP